MKARIFTTFLILFLFFAFCTKEKSAIQNKDDLTKEEKLDWLVQSLEKMTLDYRLSMQGQTVLPLDLDEAYDHADKTESPVTGTYVFQDKFRMACISALANFHVRTSVHDCGIEYYAGMSALIGIEAGRQIYNYMSSLSVPYEIGSPGIFRPTGLMETDYLFGFFEPAYYHNEALKYVYLNDPDNFFTKSLDEIVKEMYNYDYEGEYPSFNESGYDTHSAYNYINDLHPLFLIQDDEEMIDKYINMYGSNYEIEILKIYLKNISEIDSEHIASYTGDFLRIMNDFLTPDDDAYQLLHTSVTIGMYCAKAWNS